VKPSRLDEPFDPPAGTGLDGYKLVLTESGHTSFTVRSGPQSALDPGDDGHRPDARISIGDRPGRPRSGRITLGDTSRANPRGDQNDDGSTPRGGQHRGGK
jgi:hypothetical protein